MLNKLKKYNQLIIGVIIGSTLFGGMSAMAESRSIDAFYNSIKLKVNGNIITTDVEPIIVSGRTLVPARFIAESLGAEVVWNETDNTVEVNSKINGKKYTETSFAGIGAVVLEGDEIYVSANDLFSNKDKIIGEILKVIPVATPTPSPTPSPVVSPNVKVGEVSNVSTIVTRPTKTEDGVSIKYFTNGEYDQNGIGYISIGDIRTVYTKLEFRSIDSITWDFYILEEKTPIIKNIKTEKIDLNNRITVDFYLNSILPLLKDAK